MSLGMAASGSDCSWAARVDEAAARIGKTPRPWQRKVLEVRLLRALYRASSRRCCALASASASETDSRSLRGVRAGQAWRDGRDALVLSGTGTGKSLCFQLPALMRCGVVIVGIGGETRLHTVAILRGRDRLGPLPRAIAPSHRPEAAGVLRPRPANAAAA